MGTGFPQGASPPQISPSSRMLSQLPQARFERLSRVGHCRNLQGWATLGQGFDCQSIKSLTVTDQIRNSPVGPSPSHTFLWAETIFFLLRPSKNEAWTAAAQDKVWLQPGPPGQSMA